MKANYLKSLSLGVCLMLGLPAIAQGPRGHRLSAEEKAAQTITRMGEKLTLNDTEKKEMTTIYTQFFTHMEALREKGNPEQNRDHFNALATERDSQVKKVLDATRFATYEKMVAEQQQRAADHLRQKLEENPTGEQSEAKAKATVAQLNTKLALNEADTQALTEIWTSFYQQVAETRDQKTPEEMAETHKQLKTDRDAKVRQLLKTDAQYIAYLEALKEGRQQLDNHMKNKGYKNGKSIQMH